FGQAEFSSHPIDDPAVGLVRNKPIDIRGGETVSRQRLVDNRTQTMDSLTEDLASLHTKEPSTSGRGRAAVDVEDVVLATIRMQVIGQNKAAIGPCSWDRLQHDGTCAVAEEHAGATVFPIEDARERLRSDDEGGSRLAEANGVVGDREREYEPRTDGLHVKRRPPPHSEAGLHLCRCGGKRVVRGRGGKNEKVEIAAAHS